MAVQRLGTGRSSQYADSGGGGGGSTFYDESFVPTDDQTVFTLSQACVANGLTVLDVNGVVYVEGLHYTVAGTVLTWLNVDFTLKSTDLVTIRYQTS